ncbi:MAG TPA: DMT family transporter [Thermomicrobiales bacterium]|jgi:transporter family-2 protein|nr:DMT family transporter [Thermomicrobiales bacterium]
MNSALLVLALSAGCLLAVQGGLNNTLRTVIRAPVGTALISFVSGLAILVALMFVTGEGVPGGKTLGDVPWWAFTGGTWGVFGVVGTILLVPRLGAATTVAVNIAGQMLMSLLLDAEGWLGVPQRDPGLLRLAGAVVVIVGATLIAWQGSQRALRTVATTAPRDEGLPTQPSRQFPAVRLVEVLFAFTIGATMPTQAAINARLRTELDAPFTASAISFGAGTLILILCVAMFANQRPRMDLVRTVPPWALLGGACGAFYVASSVFLVPEFGAAITTALVVSGQNLASLAIDHFGWLRLPRRRATIRRVVGVSLLLIGVLFVQFG